MNGGGIATATTTGIVITTNPAYHGRRAKPRGSARGFGFLCLTKRIPKLDESGEFLLLFGNAVGQ